MILSQFTFNNARNFAVHYGPNQLKKLSNYDIVVVESKGHMAEDVKILKNSVMEVFGYISIFEIDQQQEEYEEFSDHILRDGLKSSNSSGRIFMDLRSKLWMEFLYNKVQKMVENGYTGIFIDTLSYIEENINSDRIMFAQILALCDFLDRIKSDFKDIKIVQNNGFAVILNYTKIYLDGICWENPQSFNIIMKKLNKKVIRRINTISKEHNLKVFLLTEETKNEKYFKKMAEKNKYLYYDAPKDYIGDVR